MSQSTDPRPVYVRYREEIKLLAVFLATLIPAYFVADMIARGISDSPLVASVGAIGEQFGFDQLILGTLFLGFFLAMVILLYLDFQKRVQALLLGIALVLITIVLFVQLDGVTERIGFPELVMLIGGLLLGLVAVGRDKLRYLQIGDTSGTVSSRSIEGRGQKPLTFPLAEKLFLSLLSIGVLIGFFEAHTDYEPFAYIESDTLVLQSPLQDFSLVDMTPELMTIDIVSTSVLLATLYWFIGYESGRSVFVLGPSGSGKTHLSIGMYIKAQELGYRPRNPTDELTRLVQRIIDEGDFIPERTREVHDLSFEFTAGKYFPKNVSLDAFDYPGEYLPHVPGGLEVIYDSMSRYDYEDLIRQQVDEGVAIDQSKGIETTSDIDTGMMTDGGGEVVDESNTEPSAPSAAIEVGDEVIRQRAKLMTDVVCPRVASADLLVLVLDMERLLSDVPLGSEWYSDILARLPDDQEVIIAVTKADLLLAESETGMQDMVNPAQLRNNVDQTLRQHADANRLPIAEKPYPVFYKTYEEDGERKIQMQNPMGPTGGATSIRQWPSLYGYDALLSRLGR